MLIAMALLAATPVTPAASAPAAPPATIAAAPLPPLPPIDPAQLALARVSAGVWFRDGSMARLFDNLLSTQPDSYASSMLDMNLGQVMGMAGMPAPASSGGERDLTLRQLMSKNDPYFQQRMASIHDAIVAEAARLGPRFEPQIREGLAQSMAHRFTALQLGEMNRFLTTPTGQAFADQAYLMWADPALFRAALSTVPGLIGEMPGVVQRVTAAANRYPRPARKASAPAPAPKKPLHRRKK